MIAARRLAAIVARAALRQACEALGREPIMATFIVADVIRWPEVLPMLLGSMIGGYVAAHAAQRLDQRLTKAFIIVLGAGVTAYFFWQGV
jgi:uncharacterized membrane protein YfcA